MATFAIIKDNVVENCIVADSLEIAQEITGLTCVEYTSENPAGIGFTYADGVFTNPNAPVPSEETPAEEE
jgi:hypothetical protein